MTSKKALEELGTQVGNIMYYANVVIDSDLFEIIKKDLEVLEILKNNEISISCIENSSNYDEYIEKCDYFRNLSYIKEEEFKKIKEWLENE